MSITGMYILNTKYDEKKMHRALVVLYTDRKNQFRELSNALLNEKAIHSLPHWKEYVLNFSLGVEGAFLSWSKQNPLSVNSPQMALTILRQLGHGKTSMNQLVHLMNISYDISTEFQEIYKRIE